MMNFSLFLWWIKVFNLSSFSTSFNRSLYIRYQQIH
jgi:hypothetical protein